MEVTRLYQKQYLFHCAIVFFLYKKNAHQQKEMLLKEHNYDLDSLQNKLKYGRMFINRENGWEPYTELIKSNSGLLQEIIPINE